MSDWIISGCFLTLLHSEWPKLYGVLTILSAIGLNLRIISDCLYNSKYFRLVFTIEDLDIASPAYNHFKKKLNDCVGTIDKDKVSLRIEQIRTDFPQYFSYNRINQLVSTVFIWL